MTNNEAGSFNINRNSLEWHFETIDTNNATGTIEFTVPSDDVTAFFPIKIEFTCLKSMCGLEAHTHCLLSIYLFNTKVIGVVDSVSGDSVKHEINVMTSTEEYLVI